MKARICGIGYPQMKIPVTLKNKCTKAICKLSTLELTSEAKLKSEEQE